jgi:cytochrome c553
MESPMQKLIFIPRPKLLKRCYLALVLCPAVLTFGCTAEADVQAGKAAAAQCQVCHGSNGISINPQTPNLAGQKALYLSNQLLAYRSGSRTNSIMSPLARPLSDEDIANLAAYFASLPAAGTP